MGLFEPAWMFDFDATPVSKRGKKLDKAIVAVKRIANPEKLKEVALLAPYSEVAKTAIARIDDQADLADVAIGAKSGRAAAEAAKRINDPALLKKVALEAGSFKGGDAAASRLTDQRALAEVACRSVSDRTREKALERIKDPTVVMECLRRGEVSLFASAGCLSSQEDLREAVFDLFDAEAVAYDRSLSQQKKEALFKGVAAAVGKLRGIDNYERAVAVFGDGCPAGIYAEPVYQIAKSRLVGLQARLASGQVTLVCEKCGEPVWYNEDHDSEDGSWSKSGWFSCAHGHVGGGPRRNGDYEKPRCAVMVPSRERIQGSVVHLCPKCLKLRGDSPHGCMIPSCTCRERAEYPVVVRFSSAQW